MDNSQENKSSFFRFLALSALAVFWILILLCGAPSCRGFGKWG